MPSDDYIDDTLEAVDAPAPDSDRKPDDPPSLTGSSWWYAIKRAVREFSSDGGTDLAAMLTYYTVLSMAPTLLAVFSLVSLFLASNSEAVTTMVDEFTQEYVPADYQAPVVDMVQTVTGSAAGGTIALIIGIATALWSASAYVKAFSRCANIVYGREEGRGLIKQTGTMLLTTLAMLVGLVLILISLALNETLVSGLLGPIAEPLGLSGVVNFLMGSFLPVWAWLKWPVILILVILLVAVLYYFTPNVRPPKFRWISIGSVVAIVGIGIAAIALYFYLAYFAGYSSYGAIGAVMALLFALWIFNIMLLIGLEVDVEVERARELQGGIVAEENIQLPPRDISKVKKARDTQAQLEDEGQALRENAEKTGNGGDPERNDPGSTAQSAKD